MNAFPFYPQIQSKVFQLHFCILKGNRSTWKMDGWILICLAEWLTAFFYPLPHPLKSGTFSRVLVFAKGTMWEDIYLSQ